MLTLKLGLVTGTDFDAVFIRSRPPVRSTVGETAVVCMRVHLWGSKGEAEVSAPVHYGGRRCRETGAIGRERS